MKSHAGSHYNIKSPYISVREGRIPDISLPPVLSMFLMSSNRGRLIVGNTRSICFVHLYFSFHLQRPHRRMVHSVAFGLAT